MPRSTRRALLAAPLAMPLAVPLAARAQATFPDRPVRIISPFTPGGGTDTTARTLAPGMTEALGQPIVVENRPGGAGSIGAGAVAEAPPDGHTLLVDALNHVVNPHLLNGLRFDYATAFAPVSVVTVLPQIMVVPPGLAVSNMSEYIAWARARRGQLSFGSSGNATGAHLAGALFLRETGLDITHVPYRGGSAVLPDLMAGNVVFAFATVSSATQLILAGRLKALAVASEAPVPSLPHVPTMAAAGLPGVVLDEWNGLYAPAATPPAVLARLHGAVMHALASPAARDRFAAIGARPVGLDPAAAAEYVAARRMAMGRLVREAGISIA